MSDQNNQTQDDSNGGRKYFGVIPHMAGAKLDVYEHRLYAHYIEVCGISKTDQCYQAERTIYKTCSMSKQRFLKARQGLIDKGFITFRPGTPNKKGKKGYPALTTIVDIWEENVVFCKRRSYTGQILPVEGVNNDPLKGSDITPSNNYKNIKEEKIPSPSKPDGDGRPDSDSEATKRQQVLSVACPVCNLAVNHGHDYLNTPKGITHVACLSKEYTAYAQMVVDGLADGTLRTRPRVDGDVCELCGGAVQMDKGVICLFRQKCDKCGHYNSLFVAEKVPGVEEIDNEILVPTPEEKPEPEDIQKQIEAGMWEAVKHVWRLNDNAKWQIVKLRKFLTGTVKNSEADKRYGEDWKLCQLKDNPATVAEVYAFGRWYRETYPDTTLPGKGVTLLSQFESFRGSVQYEQFLRKAEKKLQAQIAIVEPEAAEQDDDDIPRPLTEDEKAEIAELAKGFGKGGAGYND
jgi:hypothetical protein